MVYAIYASDWLWLYTYLEFAIHQIIGLLTR